MRLPTDNDYSLLESQVFISFVILKPRIANTATEPTMLTIVNRTVESNILNLSTNLSQKGECLSGREFKIFYAMIQVFFSRAII
jgi:hypothetical protein